MSEFLYNAQTLKNVESKRLIFSIKTNREAADDRPMKYVSGRIKSVSCQSSS